MGYALGGRLPSLACAQGLRVKRSAFGEALKVTLLKGVGGSIQATGLGFVLTASHEGYASVSALWVKGYAITEG